MRRILRTLGTVPGDKPATLLELAQSARSYERWLEATARKADRLRDEERRNLEQERTRASQAMTELLMTKNALRDAEKTIQGMTADAARVDQKARRAHQNRAENLREVQKQLEFAARQLSTHPLDRVIEALQTAKGLIAAGGF